MSDHEAPHIEIHENNNPDLLSQQSGTPNMSSTKTFTVDTNMQVNGDLDVTGTVTATSFIGDGSQLTGIVGGGVGLDSAGVTLLVDSDYVQARETPQDFAYSSLTGAPTALSSFTNDTNFVDSVGVISAVTSSDLDMGGNKVLFSNVYPTEADLPDATANHGMFAHVHATGAGYFAHAGSWVQLANDADIPVGGGGFDPLTDQIVIGNGASVGGSSGIAVGHETKSPLNFATSVGPFAEANGASAVAIGANAGRSSTSNTTGSIYIGQTSGTSSSGAYQIAIGNITGTSVSGAQTIAIGRGAGSTNSKSNSISIGTDAGRIGHGEFSIAIGYESGKNGTADNTIGINATGTTVAVNSQFGIDIRTSAAGSLTYDTTTDWTFGATVNAPAFVGDGSGLTGLPAGGGLEGFDVSQYDSATSNGIFEYNVSPGNQLRHLYSLNDAVSPTAYDGSLEHQVSWTISSNQQFGFRDAGGFRTKVNALANGSTATTGLVLEGETFNNSGVELVGNVKLSSLPTSDPSETGLLWNDGGIPVFSGSTAPTGGLDSAGVQGIVDDNITGGIVSVQIGPSTSVANALQQTVIGPSASSTGQYNVAIGRNATVQSSQTAGTAVGNDARVGSSQGGNNGVAVGTNARVERNAGTAIGPNAYVKNGDNATAVGMQANAWGASALALGHGANATSSNTIAIGTNTSASTQYEIDIRTSAAGSLTYDTTNDWTFGAGVTMTNLVASGATVVFNNLPTVDPVNAGQLWNDAGTMKISAG